MKMIYAIILICISMLFLTGCEPIEFTGDEINTGKETFENFVEIMKK